MKTNSITSHWLAGGKNYGISRNTTNSLLARPTSFIQRSLTISLGHTGITPLSQRLAHPRGPTDLTNTVNVENKGSIVSNHTGQCYHYVNHS